MNQTEQVTAALRTFHTPGLAEVMARLSQGGVKFTLPMLPRYAVKQVIFNNPATIVFWSDGTKTVVKCSENDTFNPEIDLAMAICKKAFGNTGAYNDVFKKWAGAGCIHVDSMRRELAKYCHGRCCDDCGLNRPGLRCGRGAFFTIPKGEEGYMTDEEIVDAYNRVFGK